MTLLRRFSIALLACAGLSLPASATTYGIDYTDLWFVPSEPGWGINLVQQYETLFATLFVYGADNTPRWYVASDLKLGQNTFTGALYQTNGPAFSAPWTGTATVTEVGSVNLSFASATAGTLTYFVGGVRVEKQIQRQTFRANNIAGTYIGGLVGRASACQNSADNGIFYLNGRLTVQHGGGNPVMRIDFNFNNGAPANCTFSGTYASAGRLGSISGGTFTCSGSSGGTFTLSEVDVGRNGFSAVFRGADSSCALDGQFGGIKDLL
jgi:hypothetical protein